MKKEKARLGNTDGKMTGSKDLPVEVGEGLPEVLREESDESSGLRLADVPAAGRDEGARIRKEESAGDELFVSEGEGDEDATTGESQEGKDTELGGREEGEDDKKKMALDTEYDGFSIYGRILCLVVKRKGTAKGKESAGAGQAMMEEWITSTQMAESGMMDD